MHINKNVGAILLAVWLILTGLIALFGLSFTGLDIVMGVLAIAAGAALLFVGSDRMTRDVGLILLSIWLILNGLISLVPLQLNGLEIVMAILAAAAGAVLLYRSVPVSGRWGNLLLGIWLIVSGLATVVSLSFTAMSMVIGIIALAAGVLILIGE